MTVREMARCGIFSALLAVCAWLALPLGDVAVTMQTFGVLLALGVLGGKLGTVSILVYLLLGALGLPVFSGFQGGLGVLLGPAGGYLWGFLLSGILFWCCGPFLGLTLRMVLALIACYVCGTLWYCFSYMDGGLWAVLLKCVVPFLIPDGLKLWLARCLSLRIRKKILL